MHFFDSCTKNLPCLPQDKFNFIEYEPRQKYMAMVAHTDDVVGEIVAAIKAKGMWNNTLVRVCIV